MMRQFPAARLRAALAAVGVAMLVLPSVALAHAELVKASPKDGATVQGTPTEIVGTYSEAMDPDGSSLRLLDAAGTEIAKGGVDPENDERMSISDLPDLAPGTYAVRSTTKSAEDGDIDRKEWSFTVEAAPTPSPSPTATPTPTPATSATPTPSSTPSAPVVTPAPTPTPSADGAGTSDGSDVLLPIIAAAVIVVVIAGFLFSRRERPPTQV
jgi:copper resistance protein C